MTEKEKEAVSGHLSEEEVETGSMSNAKAEQFFEELYKKEYDDIIRFVRRLVNDNRGIEDITQETFLEAYRKRKKLMDHPNPKGWLYITARNKWMKWAEKQRKYLLDYDSHAEGPVGDDKNRTDDYYMAEVMYSVKETLTEKDFRILRNYYEYGYSSKEMAKYLGVTENCFKVRVARMKAKLKKNIDLIVFLAVLLFRQ